MIYDIPVYMTWSNRQPVTCELIGYFTDELPEDEVSIKRIDYWGHDDWNKEFLRGGKHSETEKDFTIDESRTNSLSNYFKKFHKKLGDSNDNEQSIQKWAGPH